MFVSMTWEDQTPPVRRQQTLKSGGATAHLSLSVEDGRGLLHVNCIPRVNGNFVSSRQFTSVGTLALFLEELPAVEGSSVQLKAGALPSEWLVAKDRLLPFLSRMGLSSRVMGREITISGRMGPTPLLRKAALGFFVFDSETVEQASAQELTRIRSACLREAPELGEELLMLLDEAKGAIVRRRFLDGTVEKKAPALSDELVSALKRIQAKRIVQFSCGNGRTLKQLAQALEAEQLVGVEPSLVRYERAKVRLEQIADIHHGSVTELYTELPEDSTALLTDCLPQDGRLKAAEQTLFTTGYFEWVLCVEKQSLDDLKAWAQSVTERYGFKAACWGTRSEETAVLFRRGKRQSELAAGVAADRTIVIGGGKTIRIQAHQWRSCTENFSIWTVDPRWLMYLPAPVVSIQSHRTDGFLEHPSDAFQYYRSEGVEKVVVQYKHMGSRAICIVCRDEDAAQRRFGPNGIGCIYTRTGRPMLDDGDVFLSSLREGLSRARFWERFKTDWVCLDGEILPWTLKAERLLEESHAELLLSAETVLQELHRWAGKSGDRRELERVMEQLQSFERYRKLYDKYGAERGTPVRFAPFHLIATEGRAYSDKNHVWHMTTLNALAKRAGPSFSATKYQIVSLFDDKQINEAVSWWSDLSGSGEEGVVIKPLHFVSKGRRGSVQPAVKCRGREHLRLVYGPQYDSEDSRYRMLDRAALTNRRQKHRRVLKQFTLSVEAVRRFISGESTDSVTECVRGVLALETREAS